MTDLLGKVARVCFGAVVTGSLISGIGLVLTEDQMKPDGHSQTASTDFLQTTASNAPPYELTAEAAQLSASAASSPTNDKMDVRLHIDLARNDYSTFLETENAGRRMQLTYYIYESLGKKLSNASLIGITPDALYQMVVQHTTIFSQDKIPYLMGGQFANDLERMTLADFRQIITDTESLRLAFLRNDDSYDRNRAVAGYTLQRIEEVTSELVIKRMEATLKAYKGPTGNFDDDIPAIQMLESGVEFLGKNVMIDQSPVIQRFKKIANEQRNAIDAKADSARAAAPPSSPPTVGFAPFFPK